MKRSGKRRTALWDLTVALLGSLIYAAAIRIFIDPNHISIGGFTGLGALAEYLWDVPTGIAVLLLNLPLLILSFRRLGKPFFFKTAMATVLLSAALDCVEFLPVFTENKLLAALAGGVLTGAGLGLIFSRGMATGGSDLLAKLLRGRFRGLSYGKILLLVDGTILLLAAAVFRDLWSVLYSALTVWLSSTVIDGILSGPDRAKSVTVITAKKTAVLKRVFEEIPRGATVWPAEGGYTGDHRDMILIVLRNYELFHLKRTVKETDPEAFMIVSDAAEVVGLGFREGIPED